MRGAKQSRKTSKLPLEADASPTSTAEPAAPQGPEPGPWFLAHPYPMPPHFTGRAAEREMLSRWLTEDAAHPLLSLRALGGFGKSALAWHWLTHDVPPAAWPRVVWWSFYEGDVSFDQFLVETLAYLGRQSADGTKLTGKNAVLALVEALRAPGTLLVLDGFERVLRAFGGLDAAYLGDEGKHEANSRDCLSPLAEHFLYHVALQPHLHSKVLLTTRLCPRVLEAQGGGLLSGCREEELRQMDPADAVAFFRAHGIRGTHTEIEAACQPYGYHPLSLRLLAGLVVRDSEQPGDIAAAMRLDVSGDLVRRRHHVLEAAYNSLTPPSRKLLGSIACFRGPVNHEVLQALAKGESSASLEADRRDSIARDLIARGLLQHDAREGRFDLHPIVRRFAYDRLAQRDRKKAHARLRNYFAAVPEPDEVERLEDLAPVIELYHHTVRAGRLDEAFTLFHDRLHNPLYFQLGAYPLIIDLLRPLFPDGEDCPPRLKDERDQAWTLNELANSCSSSGQPRRAMPLVEQQNAIQERQGHKANLAIGLGNLASMIQLPIGALRAAEANLRRRIALGREIEDERQEAIGRRELGRLLAYRGANAEAQAELATVLQMFEQQEQPQSQGIVWAHRALRELLGLRTSSPPPDHDLQSALEFARRALELADEHARTNYPVEREYVRTHWLLGAVHRVAGQLAEAERHLHEALERCRRISAVEAEADILIDLARLRAATGASDEARRLAEEALLITDRSGYALQGADAHLELAKLAQAEGDPTSARHHAQETLRLATCDGPPDFTYKAAYDEATALLARPAHSATPRPPSA